MPINTRHAARRDVSYGSLDELAADLDRIAAACASGTLAHTGNWTPGQVCQHLARFWRCSLDGFPPGRPPAPMRWVAILLFKRKAVTGAPPPPGFKVPAQVTFLHPDSDVTDAQGIDELRTCIERVRDGERLSHPSPLFGRLTHDQWLRIQLGHCSMHLSFLHPE